MSIPTHGRSRWLLLSAALLSAACSNQTSDPKGATAVLAAPASAVAPVTDGPGALPQRVAAGPIHALVQLTEQPTAATFRGSFNSIALTGTTADATAAATDAAVQQLGFVNAEQATFATRVQSAQLAGTTELYRLQRIYNGIVYVTDAVGLAKLRAIPGARAVYQLNLQEPDNARGVPLVGAPQLWALGVPVRGDGIKIGVIDTGIDYTHANFGGPGTVAAFRANDPNLVEPGTFPTAKVVGGWDFAGATYNANTQPFPIPDADPIDHSGHGSHVAGTVAGLGVKKDGTTYAGPYDLTLDPTTLRIGPGAAPGASLYALKVFGDGGGSTALSALAVEWATDPNGDGNFSDHLDVVNLSLGSSYGSPNDTEAIFYTNAVNAGVTVVASAGNSNDVYFITGSPGATPSVISVAASGVGASPAIQVNAPAGLAGLKAAGTASPPAPLPAPLTADVVLATNTGTADPNDGCTALTNGAAVAGKIALIHRGTCTFLVKAKAAQAAGAVGYIIGNMPTSSWPLTMAVDATVTIPGFLIQSADRLAIEAALGTGAVNVTFDNDLVFQNANAIDTITSFSSRGPTRLLGQPMLKPDVTAPGLNVVSTAMGTGSGSASFSGTSMAAPLTTGVVALLKQLHPTWTPAELKALLMNTSGHDLYNLPVGATGRLRVSPTRVGAGRIDAAAAASTNTMVLAYDKAAPARVSVSFATIDATAAATENRIIQLKNKGTAGVTYDVTVSTAVAPPGVTVGAASPTVTVAAATNATADLTISLTTDPAAMVRGRDTTASSGGAAPFAAPNNVQPRDWLSEASGWVVLTPQGGGTTLRVPYLAAAVPASAMAAATPFATAGPTGSTNVVLSGTGVDTSGLAAAPAGVVSLATPFELAFASPRSPPLGGPIPVGFPSAEADIANLRYVGVTSNLPDVGPLASPKIYFAVNTWAPWGSPADVEFDVYLRQAGSPSWAFALYNYDLGRFTSGSPYTDVHWTVLQNLATGSVRVEDYVNGLKANQLFVPIFMSDTMVLPVYAADILAPGVNAIEYQVVAFSRRFGLVDISPVLQYDLTAPAFSSTIDPALTTLGAGYTPFRIDTAGATFPVTYDLVRARATSTGGLLMVHHHNAAGQRAQAVAVTGLTCTSSAGCVGVAGKPVCDVLTGACVGCTGNGDCVSGYCDVYGSRTCQTADCRVPGGPVCPAHYACSADYGNCQANQAMIATVVVPSSTTCPAGGLQVNTGFDDNRNGVLDANEVLSTNYVCNGMSATVTAEPAGANCATGGFKVQVGTGSPAYVCNGAPGESAALTPEPAGANCATGGLKVQVGTGAPSYVCNGATGATGGTGATGATGPTGPAGPKGSSGCATGDGGLSVFSLIGLGALLWRRRRAAIGAR